MLFHHPAVRIVMIWFLCCSLFQIQQSACVEEALSFNMARSSARMFALALALAVAAWS